MTTLIIHVPDSKTELIKKILKELDVKIDSEKAKKRSEHIPNAETVKAIEDVRKGKTTRITNLKSFFESI